MKYLVLAGCLVFAGCSAGFRIRHNLAEGQIQDPVVVRKPSVEKTLGIIPKYENHLEGYVTGAIIEPEGRPVQGVTVRVSDENGGALEGFEPGVTDQDGLFRARFSLPIRWNRVDFTGTLSADPPWQVTAPSIKFVISYKGGSGILAYYPKPLWVPVRSTILRVEPKAPPVSKKKEDPFGDMDFGQ